MTDAHNSDHHDGSGSAGRSAGIAFVIGLLLGGVVFFWTRPLRRAWIPALLTYALVAVSGGILWVPAFVVAGFIAALDAKRRETRLAFDGDLRADDGDLHESRQVTPHLQVRIRS